MTSCVARASVRWAGPARRYADRPMYLNRWMKGAVAKASSGPFGSPGPICRHEAGDRGHENRPRKAGRRLGLVLGLPGLWRPGRFPDDGHDIVGMGQKDTAALNVWRSTARRLVGQT